MPGQLFELRYSDSQRALDVLSEKFGPRNVSVFADTIHVVLTAPDRELLLIEWANVEHGLSLQSQRALPFSLEDAFISIVERTSAGARS